MRCFILALLLSLGAVPALAVDPLPFADQAERERYNALAGQLRCLVCQNQSLADSPASLAGDLRRQVFELMREGRSDEDIKTFLTDRYGDFVLYEPRLSGRTWWLWFGPGILALIALVAVAVIVRQRRQRSDTAALRPMEGEEW